MMEILLCWSLGTLGGGTVKHSAVWWLPKFQGFFSNSSKRGTSTETKCERERVSVE